MDTYQWLVLALLIIIIAEITYLLTRASSAPKLRRSGTATLIDTSVLIDGRIVAIARAGFAGSELIVPRSVVAELQYLADMADHDKRTRARHGLDVVRELQQMKHIDLKILQDSRPPDGVDSQLIRLAKRYNAQLSTIDYNLNKVAQVEGVTVLNINELAQALRISYLPGEQAMITLVQPGQGSQQAVGYLQDGTMIVVENAHRMIGREVKVEFTRNLQTQAGRMMFARLVTDSRGQQYNDNKPKNNTPPATVASPEKRPQEPQATSVAQKKKSAQKRPQATPVTPPQPSSPQSPQQPSAHQKPQTQPSQRANNQPQPQRRRPARAAEDSLVSLANQK